MITQPIRNVPHCKAHHQSSSTLGKFLIPEQELFGRFSLVPRTKFRPWSLQRKSTEVLQRSSSCSRNAALVLVVWCFIVGYVSNYHEDLIIWVLWVITCTISSILIAQSPFLPRKQKEVPFRPYCSIKLYHNIDKAIPLGTLTSWWLLLWSVRCLSKRSAMTLTES